MTKNALKIISESMKALGINYAYMKWKGEVVYPYFVGEYQEADPLNESGLQEGTFILTGHSRGSALPLEDAKQKIKEYFNPIEGHVVIAEDCSAVAIFYSNAAGVHSVDAELEKIQINLDIKEWSVK